MIMTVCLIYLVVVIGKASFVKAATENFEVRIYTHQITSNVSISADEKYGLYVKMYGTVGYTVYARISARIHDQYRLTRFGAFGVDVFKANITPPIGSPNKIQVALKDERQSVAWFIDKIVVIDSKQFYYEFVFNKWLNATQSGMIGRVHQEASLTRKYGGPHSKEYFRCMANGSKVWYKDHNTYKPGVITNLNDSNVTISTVSGQTIVLPRPSGESPPLIVNDDSFLYKRSKHIPGTYIAAFNESKVYYFGTAAHGTTAAYTTYTRSRSYTWVAYQYKFYYKGGLTQEFLRGGIIRKVDKVSTAFCHKDVPTIDPNEINAFFTCSNNNGLAGHVISKISAPNSMVCGMICSRHAKCLSFNFCNSCSLKTKNCELNKAAIGQLDRKGFNHCLMVDKAITK